MKSKNITYVPRLDHVRAFASVLIVFYHSVQLVWHQWAYNGPFLPEYWLSHRLITANPLVALVLEGHTAVALFMVLSGFVFTIGTYRREISYSKFLLNRFLRTYPLFLLLLFAGIYSFPDKFNFVSFLQTVFALGNAPQAARAGSFSAMFWTNAIEWQFYLLFPFLLIILNKSGIKNILGIMLVFLVMRALAFSEGANIRDLSYWTIIGRMDQFLIGMCLAVIYKREKLKEFRKTALILFSFILMLIFYTSYWLNQHGGWQDSSWWKMFWPSIEGSLWAAFIIFYLVGRLQVPGVISWLLCGVGRISYSIYLLHFIVLQIAINHNFCIKCSESHLVFSAFVNAGLVIFPLTIVLSILTYTFIEKPFLEMRVVYKKS